MSYDYFFLIFVATIILIRVILLPRKGHSPTIFGLRLHHYMYGLVMIVIAIFTHNITLYAVGLGFVVDQLPMAVVRVSHDWDGYYSYKIVLGVIFTVILIYTFRGYIVSII